MRTARSGLPALLLLVTAACGCSLFSQQHEDHERTRAQINGQSYDGTEGVRQASYQEDQSQEETDFSLSDLAPTNLGKSVKKWTGRGPDHKLARELYTSGDALYRQAAAAEGKERKDLFLEAAAKFSDAADRWPDSALEEDAMYMVGDSFFFADYYPKANDAYEKLLKKYPNTRHLDIVEARRFSIAQFWLELNKTKPQSVFAFNMTDNARPWRDSFGNAVRVYDRIRLDDPTGKLADDATMAAGNAKFAAGKFLDADDFYTDLRRTFPSSEHQFRAHLLGVKSKLQSYGGPSYDGKALDGAEELILQIRKQFPAEAEAEREYLAKAYAEVRFKKAEREWTLARYYEKRSEYGGARYYYNVVVNDYDDTPFADKARQRLQEIGGKPATPPQRLTWLVKIFPETDDIKPLLASGSSETKRR